MASKVAGRVQVKKNPNQNQPNNPYLSSVFLKR